MAQQPPTIFSTSSYDADVYRNFNDDILMFKRPKIEFHSKNPFKNDAYVLTIFKKGTGTGKVNLIAQEFTAPGILILRPDQILQIDDFSDDFECYIMSIKGDYMSQMNLNVTDVIPMKYLLKLYYGQYVPMQKQDIDIAVSYFDLIFKLIKDNKNPFLDSALENILRSYIHETGYYVSKNMTEAVAPKTDPIVDRLLMLIKHNFHEHRDVMYYADKLHLTPNYLYKVVKSTTGKTVSDWIEQYTISEAKSLLRDPIASILDISDRLNFPSQSFFGKYFKRIEGMSPKEYRAKVLGIR